MSRDSLGGSLATGESTTLSVVVRPLASGGFVQDFVEQPESDCAHNRMRLTLATEPPATPRIRKRGP